MEEETKCAVCKKEIFRSGNGRGVRTRRGRRAVTCSKSCAKTYRRACEGSNYKPHFDKEKSVPKGTEMKSKYPIGHYLGG